MRTILLLIVPITCLLSLTGCETGRRRNETAHTVEKWQVVTNSAGKARSFLVFRERWVDRGSLTFAGLFTDPAIAGWSDATTNQAALGGGMRITFGTASSKTDSAGLTAAGGAVGDVIGAALKTAVKP